MVDRVEQLIHSASLAQTPLTRPSKVVDGTVRVTRLTRPGSGVPVPPQVS
jgi:hypothetical protein